MGRRPRLADESFLPGMTRGEIKKRYDAEKDERDALRLLVAYHYKCGRSIKEAADAAGTRNRNARRWIAAMYKRGPDALARRKSQGAPGWLTGDQYIQVVMDVFRGPRACGYKADEWSYVLIHKHVCKKFKTGIGYGALLRNLHQLRIVIKTTRPARSGMAPRGARPGLRRGARGAILDCTGRTGRPPAGGARAKGRGRALTAEMRGRLPPRLARSGLPDEYLADPPKLLLKG